MPLIYLAVGLLALVAYQVGRSRSTIFRVGCEPRIISVPPRQHPVRRLVARPPVAVAVSGFLDVLSSGGRPERGLAVAALREAVAAGDRDTAQLVSEYLGMVDMNSGAGERVVAGAEVPDTVETQPGTTEVEWGKPPIPGVEESDWRQFVDSLATRDVGYCTDNHVGVFEHNRRRLRQLEIPEDSLADVGTQYEALCRDLSDYYARCAKLIADYTGDVVEVSDSKVPVTLSGVLGLLKSAGPKGAESWLTNEADRKSFPATTETFLRVNGCF